MSAPDRDAVPVSSPGQCCREGYCIEVDAGEVHELTRDQAERVRDLLTARSPRPAAVGEDAVEAAARAMLKGEFDRGLAAHEWGDYPLVDEQMLDNARDALAAALPLLAPGQSEAEVALCARKCTPGDVDENCPFHAPDEGEVLVRRMLVALTEQRAIDSAHHGSAPYAPWTVEAVRELLALARTAPAEDGAE